MPGVFYGDSGTNRTMISITYGDAGTNRTIVEMWYGDAGTNRKVWPAATVALTNHTVYASRIGAGIVNAVFELNTSGSALGATTPAGGIGDGPFAGEWMLTGPSSAYDARFTIVSGTLTSGSGAGVWLNLGTTRNWGRNAGAGIGTNTCIGTVEIRDASTLVVLATATIDLTAERA